MGRLPWYSGLVETCDQFVELAKATILIGSLLATVISLDQEAVGVVGEVARRPDTVMQNGRKQR